MHKDDIILTESSIGKLKAELAQMKTVKRAEITQAIRTARGYGDLSENFEYHAARQEQGILNGKIAELERILEIAVIVPDAPQNEYDIGLGCIVKVRDLDEDDEWEYWLVDHHNADPMNDRISVSSPVGQALIGRAVGDNIEVEIPAGLAHYEIVAVRWE